jgi:hypothetical protein
MTDLNISADWLSRECLRWIRFSIDHCIVILEYNRSRRPCRILIGQITRSSEPDFVVASPCVWVAILRAACCRFFYKPAGKAIFEALMRYSILVSRGRIHGYDVPPVTRDSSRHLLKFHALDVAGGIRDVMEHLCAFLSRYNCVTCVFEEAPSE